jgi:uncharacterized membrane protein YdjX (TVP38/TMEM64 family)
MKIPFWAKWFLFLIVLFTSLILPLIFLETSFSSYSQKALAWSQGNLFETSLIVIIALAADVFLPVPNGLTNTLAGASLGWSLASFVVWIGLNLGCLFGYLVGRFVGRPLAVHIIGLKDFQSAQKTAKRFNVISLILARPVPAFAELTTLSAGITRMPFLKFILVVSTANIGVAIIFAGIGAAALASSSSTLAFFGVAILPAIFYLSYKKFIG